MKPGEGAEYCCNLRNGLPLSDNHLEHIIDIRALQDLPYRALVPVLRELRRVLKSGEILHLSLPDLERGIRACLRNDPGYFYVRDEGAGSIGGKLIVQMLRYGDTRRPFTCDLIEGLLAKGGFRQAQALPVQAHAQPVSRNRGTG